MSKPLTQVKIARAVERARDLAVPRAFVNARIQAGRYAEVGHLVLGSVLSIEEPAPSPYGYFGNSFARFGGNQYCGKITTAKRRKVNGVRKVVSRKTTFRCFKPEYISVSISVTFGATPGPVVVP